MHRLCMTLLRMLFLLCLGCNAYHSVLSRGTNVDRCVVLRARLHVGRQRFYGSSIPLSSTCCGMVILGAVVTVVAVFDGRRDGLAARLLKLSACSVVLWQSRFAGCAWRVLGANAGSCGCSDCGLAGASWAVEVASDLLLLLFMVM